MAILFSDDFTGTNGAALNATRWPSISSNGGSVAIQGNQARVTTPSTTWFEETASAQNGLPSDFDLTLDIEIQTVTNWHFPFILYRTDFNGAATGDYYRLALSVDSTNVDYVIERYDNYAATSMATTITESVLAVNDVVHVRIKLAGGLHQIRWWLNGDPEPSTWKFEFTDSTYNSNTGLTFGVQTGSTTASVDFDNIAMSTDTTVTLADFAWAVRPTVSDLELTQGGSMTGSAGWTAGVSSDGSSSYAAWAKTAALEALTDQYTIVVVCDPNQVASGWRGLFSVPAYSSGSHVSTFHSLALGAHNNTSSLFHYRTISNAGSFQTSSTGSINTATDGRRCYAARRNGAALDFVVDGALRTSTTTGTGAIDWVPSGDVTVASRSRTDPGEGCAGTYYFVGVADRPLTNAELLAIAYDPLNFEGASATVLSPATQATAAGQSFNASVRVSSTAAQPAAAGSASPTTPDAATNASAATAAGVATTSTSNGVTGAGTATGTGTAQAPAPRLRTSAGQGAASGSASAATGTHRSTAGAATGASTAPDGAAHVDSTSGAASGTGAGFSTSPRSSSSAGLASAVGTAASASVRVRTSAAQAAATGAAFQATTAAGQASATGAALPASAQVVSPAGQGAATGAAHQSAPDVASSAANATGVGVANAPSKTVRTSSTQATAMGVAYTASVTTDVATNANAEAGTAVGQAFNAGVRISVGASQASAAGSAALTGPIVRPGAAPALAAGSAAGPSNVVVTGAGQASSVGTAQPARASLSRSAGLAAATGAPNPSTAVVRSLAGAGAAPGEGNDAAVSSANLTPAQADPAEASGQAYHASVRVGSAASTTTAAGTSTTARSRVQTGGASASASTSSFSPKPGVGPSPAAGVSEGQSDAGAIRIQTFPGFAIGTGAGHDGDAVQLIWVYDEIATIEYVRPEEAGSSTVRYQRPGEGGERSVKYTKPKQRRPSY